MPCFLSDRSEGAQGSSPPVQKARGERIKGDPQVGYLSTRYALVSPLGPLGFECAEHRRTPRPSVERIRRKAPLPFGSQLGIWFAQLELLELLKLLELLDTIRGSWPYASCILSTI